jgi:RluA family pseudouridine synthase
MAAPPVAPTVLLQDAHVLVIDKPSGWLVHDKADAASILTWARAHAADSGVDPAGVQLVHRLDRDTSGVLVIALSAAAAAPLHAAFRERRVYKIYVALTAPVPAVRWARVEHALAARRVEGGERMVVVDKGGQAATSEVEVLSRGRRFGFVRVLPDQGRKHQIRVALAELGAPIAGDFLYGGPRVARIAPRVMLHAFGLDLAHPVEPDRHLKLRAPLPPDLLALFAEDGGELPGDIDRRHRPPPTPPTRSARPRSRRQRRPR